MEVISLVWMGVRDGRKRGGTGTVSKSLVYTFILIQFLFRNIKVV